MILPGILASQISGHLANYAFESIATFNGNGSSGTISFTSIPSTYKHLQLRMILRSTRTGTANGTNFRFNSDSSNAYSFHRLIGNGSSASADGYANNDAAWTVQLSASALSNTYAASIIDILDYQNTSKIKTVRNLTGYDLNGSGSIYLSSSGWYNTAAINRIDIYADGSGNWTTGTQIALYGIKE